MPALETVPHPPDTDLISSLKPQFKKCDFVVSSQNLKKEKKRTTTKNESRSHHNHHTLPWATFTPPPEGLPDSFFWSPASLASSSVLS